MADTPPLQKKDYALLLSYCPDLRRMTAPEREKLAELFTLKDYPADHTFYRPGLDLPRGHEGPADPERDKLRIVVAGHVQLERRFGDTRGRRSCGPLEMLGEEAVIEWDERRRGDTLAKRARPENLHATEKVWLLELPYDKFPEAFPVGGSGLSCVHAAEQVNAIAPRVVEVLESSQQLGNVKSSDLYHLLEGAEVIPAGSSLVTRGHVPENFFVLLEGRFTFSRPGAKPTILNAPAVAALDGLIGGVPIDSDMGVEGSSTVLRVSGETFWQLFNLDADFQRAIVRTNQVDPRYLGDAGQKGKSSLLLVLGSDGLTDTRPEISQVLDKLTDLLGERIARHLYDRVLVLHLEPAGTPKRAPEIVDFAEGFEDEARDDCPWLEHRWVAIDDGFAATVQREVAVLAPPRTGRAPRGRAEVVLLDPSHIRRDEAIDGVGELDIPCKVVLLSPRPGELPPFKFLVHGTAIQHTGVLSPDPPIAGLGFALRRARNEVSDAPAGVRSKLEAAASSLGDLAESVRLNAGSVITDIAQGALRSVRGASNEAWAIGTVRVRFSSELLTRLAPASPGPMRLDALLDSMSELSEGEKAAIVGTFDHWARGATSRRVGLTLSGGGPYGVIHIPLLQRLLERGLPIDLLSGTSVGSSVGAYYAVLGREGLDLFIEHGLRMNVASLVSILTSAAFQAVVGFDLGSVALIDTEIPFFPVVTDADVGIEWDVRHGSYALGVRASGSLPPLGPTVIGNRRFLDGGLVANVPVNVLRDEGATLIMASNAIASVSPQGRFKSARFGIFQPVVEALQESNVLGRLDDMRRMIPLIFRTVGDAQANAADVTYRPSYRDVSFWSNFNEASIQRGDESPEIERRVTELHNRWRSLLRHPPSMVRIDRLKKRLELLAPVCFTEQDGVDPSSADILTEAAQFLCLRTEGLRITRLRVEAAASSQASAERRAVAVMTFLQQGGVHPERLTAKGVSAAKSSLIFPIEAQTLSEEEARRRLEELKSRAEKAERSALAKALTMGAEWNCRRGDLDLGRLLALESAALDRSPETDAVLRHALARRGWTVRRLVGEKAMQQMDLSPDGRRLAVGSADGQVRIWDSSVETERQARVEPLAIIDHRTRSDAGIAGVAWSADGRLVASAGFDWKIKVHAVAADGALTPVFEDSSGTWSQWGLAFSPQGARLLGTSGGSRSRVAVWDCASPAPPRIVEHEGDVKRASWSPDGSLVAAGTELGKLVVWSPADAEPMPRLIASVSGPIADLAWAPDSSERIAFAHGNEAMILDSFPDGAQIVLAGHTKPVRSVAWSPKGDRLATASDDGSARIWASDGRFLMNLRGDGGAVHGVAWHPEGERVATRSEQGAAVLWDAETGEPVARLLGHDGAINAGAFTSDGRRFITGSIDSTVRVWDPLASAQVIQEGERGAHHPRDAGLALTGSADGSAHVWDPRSGAPIAQLVPPDAVGRAEVCFSPSGDLLAVVREGEALVRVFRSGSFGAPLHELADEVEDLRSTRPGLSPDGRWLAVKRRRSLAVWDLAASPPTRRLLDTSQDGAPCDVESFTWDPLRPGRLAVCRWVQRRAVAVFDLARGDAPVLTLEGSKDGVWCVAYSADGALMALGCNDNQAYLHAADDGRLLGTIPHRNAVKCLAFSGYLLGTGDGGRVAAIFQIQTEPFSAQQVSARQDHLDAVEAVAFSPDGASFASGSAAGRVSLWRKGAGAEPWSVAATLDGHSGKVRSLSFSPDGARLLTTGSDDSALVHITRFEELVAAVGAMPGPGQMPVDDWLRFFGTSVPHRPTWPRQARSPEAASRNSR